MRNKGCITKRQSCAFALAVFLALAPIAACALGGTSGKADPRVYLYGTNTSGAPVEAEKPVPTVIPSATMTLHISCSCPDYNHVGKQWSHYFSMDGIRVMDGSEIILFVGQEIEIYAEITEHDKYNDIGSCRDIATITAEDLMNGLTIDQLIEVEENKGRYSGNIAVWTVTYTFSP